MRTFFPVIALIFIFTACNKEDNLQQQTNTGSSSTVRLSELVFYSDSSFSGTGTDSVAYRIDYSGNTITRMVKVRQHPALGGVNLYENYADSITFIYTGNRLIRRNVYIGAALVKRNDYSYTGNNLTLDQEQWTGLGFTYTGNITHQYTGQQRNMDYGVFSGGFKDSATYNYNINGDISSMLAYNTGMFGWNTYAYNITYTPQANALRSLIGNDELLATMLGGSPAVQPPGRVPDSITFTYDGVVSYKRKAVQQIHPSGYVQQMINYYHKPFIRISITPQRLPYVQLKYDNL